MAFAHAGRYGPEVVITPSGVVARGISVPVYTTGTTTLVTLYTDESKGTTAPNPATTDEHGELQFFVAPGDYDINVLGTTLTVTVEVNPLDIGSGGWQLNPVFQSFNHADYTAHVNDLVLADGGNVFLPHDAPVGSVIVVIAFGAQVDVFDNDQTTIAEWVVAGAGLAQMGGFPMGGAIFVMTPGELGASHNFWHPITAITPPSLIELSGDVIGTASASTVSMIGGVPISVRAGNPNGVMTASAIGELCIDVATPALYQAHAADNSHWVRVGTPACPYADITASTPTNTFAGGGGNSTIDLNLLTLAVSDGSGAVSINSDTETIELAAGAYVVTMVATAQLTTGTFWSIFPDAMSNIAFGGFGDWVNAHPGNSYEVRRTCFLVTTADTPGSFKVGVSVANATSGDSIFQAEISVVKVA